MRDSDRLKEKLEVSLDNRQIFYLFFGSAVVACLVFVVAASMTSSRAAGWFGAVTFLGDLSVLHHANKVLAELLFTTFFFVGTLALWKALTKQSWRLAALSGCIFGISCLIRPVSL